ncbi:MAG: recN [Phycisphaerales bacterium]|nr:recN [Phycisphaerales bacterium]
MLRELHISNLAVIADAKIELAAGLNCFTGATGAGKSLVIGAIELLLGLRSPSDMLRKGANEGRVSGVFDVGDKRLLKQIEAACDLSLAETGGEVLLTRRLFASGRSGVSLNGHPITLAMLKNVAETLVDVHGQHDHQYLLRPSNQLAVIDEFAALVPLREKYHAAFTELSEVRRRLHELETGTKLREQHLDFARYQLKELDSAALRPNEYADLTARAGVLNNLGRLRNDASTVQEGLSEADDALVNRLQAISSTLTELTAVDAALAPIANTVKEATIQLSEASYDLARYLNRLELDPGELAEVNERLNTLNRIVKKYGPTVEIVLAKHAELAKQVTELERAGEDTTKLTAKLKPLAAELEKIGRELSTKRKKAAAELRPRIESQLGALGMDKATFSVDVRPSEPGPSGADEIEFLVRTNPGLAESPLRKIASGGEMSRIMLALKGVLAAGDRVSVLVFDEIDANIGGRLGSIIGEKLRSLAEHHQVLCITHLPQIACYADRHLTVRKEQDKNQTKTSVRMMDGDERIEEIAEMIGGHRITETTRAQARELLETAKSQTKPAKRRKQSA